jgi:heme oxygenase
MSEVLKRAGAIAARMAPKLREELERKPLSRLLRRESWPDHERAQYHPFEVALAEGTISREGYADLLAQVREVYIALEQRGAELKDDPIAGRVWFPEVLRLSSVEADLDFYWPSWRTESSILPVTKEYAERVRTATPTHFVAHHYNRYLADLSGGMFIAAALKRSWDLNGDGLRYYEFDGISSADEWKQAYRGVLDGLPIDIDGKMDLIGEVAAGYEYNIEMAERLGGMYLKQAG